MLDKLVIHLKNIIFFKAIIYVVIAIVLFILMPIFKEDLAKSANRQLESQAFLSAATLKLESINSSIKFFDLSGIKRYSFTKNSS